MDETQTTEDPSEVLVDSTVENEPIATTDYTEQLENIQILLENQQVLLQDSFDLWVNLGFFGIGLIVALVAMTLFFKVATKW